jgi:threonylcarbamoyladenosine tRNA methylthiotransferase MtaB
MKIDREISIFCNKVKYNIIKHISNNSRSFNLYYTTRSRPYIKVQDGCNMPCSYCIVPLARGRSKSIGNSEILSQIDYLESQGYQEIVLTGIHLGAYGHDLSPKTNLATLISNILKKSKIPRIRLSSLEMNEINEEMIEIMQEKRICNHIHVPLQSGDTSILKLMKRGYTAHDYKKKIETISKKVPQVCIGSDIIVGFPGEGDIEFNNTKNLLELLPISYLHIFTFSPRKHTKAASLIPQIEISHKRSRFHVMNDLNMKKRDIYMKSQIDRDLNIIVEEKLDKNYILGTSGNYMKVKVKTTQYNKKSIMNVKVIGAEKNMLCAVPVDTQ